MSTIGSEVKHLEKEKQKTERKEHILVCLSFSPSNEKIIRTAAQMARAFGANFTALYVQTAEPAEKTPEDQARLQKHIRLAGQSGAEIVTTHSEDIALQIAEYARISEVTRIVIGKSMMDQGFFRKRRGWTERLTDLVPDLEIHIIPDSNIITIYLVGVMMTSILTSGYTCSVISSVISVVLFNYFLTEPRLTLYAYGSGYPVTFAIMLGISILTGTLASKLKENAKLSARDAFLTKILFNTSQLLQKAEDASEIFDITATKLVKLLGRDLTAAPAGAQESRIVRGTLYSAQTGGKTEKSLTQGNRKSFSGFSTAGKEEKNVWIAVEDNGPGIPKESREHVFEMFYSGKNKVSDSRRSLGLGLALCRSIVNAHGGEIALYDCDPQGCCFRFNLPLSEVNLNE